MYTSNFIFIAFLYIIYSIPAVIASSSLSAFREAIIAAYLLLFAAIYFLAKQNSIRKKINIALENKILPWAMISFFAICNFIIYNKFGVGVHTANEAMITPIMSLISGGDLYANLLSEGSPSSPGPGWLIQNIFFSLTDNLRLMMPFYLILLLYVFKIFKLKTSIFTFLTVLLLFSYQFIILSGAGYDIPVFSIYFLMLSIIGFYYPKSLINTLIFAFIIGVATTTRIIFISLIPIYCILFWRESKIIFYTFLIVSAVASISFHGYFFLQDAPYQPLHLIHRGDENVGKYLIALGGSLTTIIYFYKFIRYQNNFIDWIVVNAILLGIPLLTIAFGELYSVNFEFKIWEGANYLSPVVVFLIFILSYKFCSNQEFLKRG